MNYSARRNGWEGGLKKGSTITSLQGQNSGSGKGGRKVLFERTKRKHLETNAADEHDAALRFLQGPVVRP
jgi:hypothetical protein